MSTSFKCDFCTSGNIQHVHDPINSTRGMKVYVCMKCGLVQSISTSAYSSAPPGSMSGDANRSSYRYTKELVFDNYLQLFKSHINFADLERVLDIGSNRGIFVHWALDNFPHILIDAIEPQQSVVESYCDHQNVSLKIARFEDVQLNENTYDFVYCVHTLEHARSASQMMTQSYRSLKPGGILFLAVPQTLLFHNNLVEEIFIDPHTFHFDLNILVDFSSQLGFKTVYSSRNEDAEVILILKKEVAHIGNFVPSNQDAAQDNVRKIADYQKGLHDNRVLLRKIGAELNDLSLTGSLIIWGAGRLFDLLVREGGLVTSRVTVVFDKVLYKFINKSHDCVISKARPRTELDESSVIVFIASREYAAEIKAEANKLGYEKIISFTDFFSD